MKKRIVKNKQNRINFKKFEKKKIILKYLYNNNLKLNYYLRTRLYNTVIRLPKTSRQSYLKPICIITGKARGVHNLFRMSRIQVKKLQSMGLLSGLKKSSW